MNGTTTDGSAEICGACNGRGWQPNIKTGINEVCPVCGGSGKRSQRLEVVC